MNIYKTRKGFIVRSDEGELFLSKETDWDLYINRDDLYEKLSEEISTLTADASLESVIESDLLAPVGQQEIWASGVTYMRSREARMEESKDSGGGDFYARVYEADRPELFFKSTAARAVGPGDEVIIRRDSKWNVPEPELTLLMASSGKIVGYTIGNDMSSRDIEGENPLYLPQAKTYDGAASLGPSIYVPAEPISAETLISIAIHRGGEPVFENNIQLNRMKRKLPDLAGYLFRECTFPVGAFLMTGTGIVPPNEFTLIVGDEIYITIENIGTLKNTVSQKN